MDNENGEEFKWCPLWKRELFEWEEELK